MTSRELLNLKDKLDKLGKDKARLEGAKEQVLKTMKIEFDCSSVKEGEKLVEELNKDISKQEEALQKGIDEVEDELARS